MHDNTTSNLVNWQRHASEFEREHPLGEGLPNPRARMSATAGENTWNITVQEEDVLPQHQLHITSMQTKESFRPFVMFGDSVASTKTARVQDGCLKWGSGDREVSLDLATTTYEIQQPMGVQVDTSILPHELQESGLLVAVFRVKCLFKYEPTRTTRINWTGFHLQFSIPCNHPQESKKGAFPNQIINIPVQPGTPVDKTFHMVVPQTLDFDSCLQVTMCGHRAGGDRGLYAECHYQLGSLPFPLSSYGPAQLKETTLKGRMLDNYTWSSYKNAIVFDYLTVSCKLPKITVFSSPASKSIRLLDELCNPQLTMFNTPAISTMNRLCKQTQEAISKLNHAKPEFTPVHGLYFGVNRGKNLGFPAATMSLQRPSLRGEPAYLEAILDNIGAAMGVSALSFEQNKASDNSLRLMTRACTMQALSYPYSTDTKINSKGTQESVDLWNVSGCLGKWSSNDCEDSGAFSFQMWREFSEVPPQVANEYPYLRTAQQIANSYIAFICTFCVYGKQAGDSAETSGKNILGHMACVCLPKSHMGSKIRVEDPLFLKSLEQDNARRPKLCECETELPRLYMEGTGWMNPWPHPTLLREPKGIHAKPVQTAKTLLTLSQSLHPLLNTNAVNDAELKAAAEQLIRVEGPTTRMPDEMSKQDVLNTMRTSEPFVFTQAITGLQTSWGTDSIRNKMNMDKAKIGVDFALCYDEGDRCGVQMSDFVLSEKPLSLMPLLKINKDEARMCQESSLIRPTRSHVGAQFMNPIRLSEDNADGQTFFSMQRRFLKCTPEEAHQELIETSKQIYQQFGINATCHKPIETTFQGSTPVILFPVSF